MKPKTSLFIAGPLVAIAVAALVIGVIKTQSYTAEPHKTVTQAELKQQLASKQAEAEKTAALSPNPEPSHPATPPEAPQPPNPAPAAPPAPVATLPSTGSSLSVLLAIGMISVIVYLSLGLRHQSTRN